MSKMDWGFTEDGDLQLGAPKVDDNNNVLYYHEDDTVSIEPIHNGKEGKMIRDLTYVLDRNAMKQVIYNRLKTDAPDWYHHPNMGGNLTDLIGEPNTRDTGNLGVSYITDALTYDGFISPMQLSVRAVPTSPEEIIFFITIAMTDGETYRLPLTFNLTHGLKEV